MTYRWMTACMLIATGLAAGKEPQAPGPIKVELELTAKSDAPTLKGIAPYDEALVTYAYKVRKVREGTLPDKRVRVVHWGIFDRLEQDVLGWKPGRRVTLRLRRLSDYPHLESAKRKNMLEADFDAAVWFHVDQDLKRHHPRDGEFDYGGGDFTRKLRDLYAMRRQVRLVALGDSRTFSGVRADLFYGGANPVAPVAYNLAINSSGVKTWAPLIERVLLHLPELEWVVIGASPRVVGNLWSGAQYRKLVRSRAFKQDVKNRSRRWKCKAGKELPAAQLGVKDPDFGWNRDTAKMRPNKYGYSGKGKANWRLDLDDWRRLEAVIDKLDREGVNVLVFTPPVYGGTERRPAPDDDGTSVAGNQALVARFGAMEKLYRRFHFLDANRCAFHDFKPEHFRNEDHLNAAGATKLTRKLEAFRANPAFGGEEVITETTKGLAWARLRGGTRAYVDRDYAYLRIPKALRGLAVLRPRNDDKRAADPPMRFRTVRPLKLYLLWPEKEQRPAWLGGFKRTKLIAELEKVGRMRVYTAGKPAGVVELPSAGESADSLYTVAVEVAGKRKTGD